VIDDRASLRRYLVIDGQSEWATRARRSLEFCEMQQHSDCLNVPGVTNTPPCCVPSICSSLNALVRHLIVYRLLEGVGQID
jgi:hypothetical protein